MATGKTEICNLALMRAGTGKSIADFDSTPSQEAKVLRTIYPQALEEVLRAHPWRFARRRVVLADLGTPPSNWAFAYAYPDGCLQLLQLVLPGQRWPRWDCQPAFEVGSNDTQTVIWTDLEQAECIFTAQVDDPARFDALFRSALVWKIAAEVARPLAGKPDAGNLAEKAYLQALSAAAAQSLNEAHEGPEPDSEFLTVRQ